MAFDAITGYLQVASNWNVQKNGPSSGLGFPPTVNSNSLNLKQQYTTGGAVANGINEESATIITIAPGGSATVNLQNLIDVLGVPNVVLVRLKKIVFCLLSPTQDTINGTVCSGVTIGAAPTNPSPLNLGSPSQTVKLFNGDVYGYATGNAAGIPVGAGSSNVLLTNNDSGNAASVLVNFAGCTI